MESYTFIVVGGGQRRVSKVADSFICALPWGGTPPPGHDDSLQLAAPPFQIDAPSILMPIFTRKNRLI